MANLVQFERSGDNRAQIGCAEGADMRVEDGLAGVGVADTGIANEDDGTENLIGKRIREIRSQRGISASVLGEKVGVSRSMISQIELGRTNASVLVLKAIAGALEVPLFTLFVEDRAGGEIVRRADRATLLLPGSDVVRELLVPDTHRKMTLLTAVFGPGHKSSFEPSAHQGEECVVATRGEITVYYHTEVVQLAEGDSFYFDSTVPHLFVNNTTEEAEIIVAICN